MVWNHQFLRRKLLTLLKKRALVEQLLITNYVTGYSQDRDIGANLFQSIHCPDCGPVPVPEDQLPLLLPDVESYEPTGTGESPLAAIDEWVNTTCPMLW